MDIFKLEADGPCEAEGSSGLREGYVYRRTDDPNISFKNKEKYVNEPISNSVSLSFLHFGISDNVNMKRVL